MGSILFYKTIFFVKSLFEVKIDFGCDFDANLAPFWRDFGRLGSPGGILGRLETLVLVTWVGL